MELIITVGLGFACLCLWAIDEHIVKLIELQTKANEKLELIERHVSESVGHHEETAYQVRQLAERK